MFTSVKEPDLKVLKRVIGAPGDTITMESGSLRLNGQFVAEPYVEHRDASKTAEPVQRDRMRIWQLPHVVIGDSTWSHPDISSPVAYLEGWYVDADLRRGGIGAALVRAAEAWARAYRYRELGSDTELDNLVSQQGHQRLGFTEVGRVVQYRRSL